MLTHRSRYAWEHGGGASTLPWTIVASHLLPIPCQYIIRRLTKVPVIVTWKLALDVLLRRGGDKQHLYDGEGDVGRSGGGGGGGGGGGVLGAVLGTDRRPGEETEGLLAA